MKEFKYVIKDEQGIHARPAGLFVKEAAAFPCKVTIEKDGKEADAKRIFAVIGLEVKCGQEITLKTDGENEEEAMNNFPLSQKKTYKKYVSIYKMIKNANKSYIREKLKNQEPGFAKSGSWCTI